MQRIQFYPSATLADILDAEAKKNGVSISTFITDLLNDYYGLTKKNTPNITHLSAIVLREVEDYLKKANSRIEFDLLSASPTYRNIDMTCGKKPSAVRASIGRSFASKIGRAPFANVRKYRVNGVQQLSVNNALLYETF